MTLVKELLIALAVLVGVIQGSFQNLIIISLDGFRFDYLERNVTPTINSIGQEGVRAQYMTPVFPSKTFPNHYSYVTGLYPETHGIVSNTIYDPNFDAYFRISDPTATGDARWWGGEPIWNTAEFQGQKAGSCFWPGSEAPIQGIRPSYWIPYDGSFSNSDRVKLLLEWLSLPEGERPNFLTLYFSLVDDYGHAYGPESSRMLEALEEVDDVIAQLVKGLEDLGIYNQTHIAISADHGMTTISQNRVILIDDFIDLSKVEIVDWSPLTAIIPQEGYEDAIFKNLSQNAEQRHYKVYQKNGEERIPERYHYTNNERITPILLEADLGWSVTNRATYERNPGSFNGGNHGYDNQDQDMWGLFVAKGPKIRKGVTIDPFPVVDAYHFLAKILELRPAANEGNPNSSLIQQALL